MVLSSQFLSPQVLQKIEAELISGAPVDHIVTKTGVGKTTIYRFRANLKAYGSIRCPIRVRRGPSSTIDDEAIQGIIDYLTEYTTATLQEVQEFLEEEYSIYCSEPTVCRAMKKANHTRKVVQAIALQQDPILRNRYRATISQYTVEQLCFVDESASNERTAQRRMGWSPRGKPCRVVRSSKRSKRWSILPAITIEGYIAYEIYQDSFTTERFNSWIEQDLLPIMQPYPLPCSVLIMDNHSVHHSERLSELCEARGVELVYLPPYSPDMNPIEQSFAQLKSWMRRNQALAKVYNDNFEGFIRLALRLFMEGRGAAGHFRACGYGSVEAQNEDEPAESDRDDSSIDIEL